MFIETTRTYHHRRNLSMALSKQRSKQPDLFIVTSDLPTSPGHVFYNRLNQLLADAGFDEFVGKLWAPYYAETISCPSTSPGLYFRTFFVGYFGVAESATRHIVGGGWASP
jgi:transposase